MWIKTQDGGILEAKSDIHANEGATVSVYGRIVAAFATQAEAQAEVDRIAIALAAGVDVYVVGKGIMGVDMDSTSAICDGYTPIRLEGEEHEAAVDAEL